MSSSISLQNFESCGVSPFKSPGCQLRTWDNNELEISNPGKGDTSVDEYIKEGRSSLLLVGNHQWPGVSITLDAPTKMEETDKITFWIKPRTSNGGPNTYAVKLWDIDGKQAEVWTDHGQDPSVPAESRPSPVRIPDNTWTKVSFPVSQFRGLNLNGKNGAATAIEIKGYWDHSEYKIDDLRLEKK